MSIETRSGSRQSSAASPAARRSGRLRSRLAVLAAIVAATLGGASIARAQSVLALSPDVTIPLGAGALVTRDHAVALDNQLGVVVLQNLGTLPDAVDVIGYADLGNGTRLFTVDTTVPLAGGVLARRGDVVAWNGSAYSILFDAAAEGLPPGAATDAVAAGYDGGLLLSFDVGVSLPGPLHVADEDLVRWNGTAFTLALDGSAAGMTSALDVDAVDDLGPSSFLVSFDTGGTLGSVTFADEDILRRQGGVWTLERDSSVADAAWGPADLDALQVPEPSQGVGLLAGALLLAVCGPALAARRARVARRAFAASIVFAVSVGAVLVSAPARAQDGALEINQSCATTGGCFPGDTAGFPVTITASGSYRLTSNLTVPTENLDGIFISASNVRIDLDGFAVAGPVVCTGTLISCTPSGVGTGIEASSARNDLRVENGSILGMATGISLSGTGIEIDRVRVSSNRLTGISVGVAARVSDSIVFRNGGAGISAGRGSSVIGCAVSRNGLTGIALFQTAALGGLVASGNSLHDNQGSGITSYSGSSVITRNTAYSNGAHGISANGGAQISGNTVTFNTDNGLDLGLSDSGYTENAMASNGTDVVGGLSLGGNSCGGTPACP